MSIAYMCSHCDALSSYYIDNLENGTEIKCSWCGGTTIVALTAVKEVEEEPFSFTPEQEARIQQLIDGAYRESYKKAVEGGGR